MNIGELFSGVANLFKSEDITETLTDTRTRIREGLIPVVTECINNTKDLSFKDNRDYQSGLATIKRHYHGTEKMELFPALAYISMNAEGTIDKLISLVDKYFTATVDKDSITYPRAQILTLANNIDFIADFIPKYCRFIIAKQTEINGGMKVEKSLSRAQIKYINSNTLNFFKTISVLSRTSVKDIEKQLKDIPDVAVTESGEENSLFNKFKLDPTGSVNNFVSASINPFYYAGVYLVDRRHNKYKLAKEEVEAIKIELDYMNTQLANGQGDALLERQKEKALERLDKLEYQIHEHEKRVLDTRY